MIPAPITKSRRRSANRLGVDMRAEPYPRRQPCVWTEESAEQSSRQGSGEAPSGPPIKAVVVLSCGPVKAIEAVEVDHS